MTDPNAAITGWFEGDPKLYGGVKYTPRVYYCDGEVITQVWVDGNGVVSKTVPSGECQAIPDCCDNDYKIKVFSTIVAEGGTFDPGAMPGGLGIGAFVHHFIVTCLNHNDNVKLNGSPWGLKDYFNGDAFPPGIYLENDNVFTVDAGAIGTKLNFKVSIKIPTA